MPASIYHFLIGLIPLIIFWNKVKDKRLLILVFLIGSLAIDIDHLMVGAPCGIKDTLVNANCADGYVGQFIFHHLLFWIPFGIISKLLKWEWGFILAVFVLVHIFTDVVFNGHGFVGYW